MNKFLSHPIINNNERSIWLILLLLCGFILHFYHLEHPEKVVFDEVHFGSFVDAYCCSGQRFFDIHPPHAKLLIAGTAKLLGYQGGQDFTLINNFFPAKDSFSLRFLPAFVGSFLAPLIFFIVLQLGAHRNTALFAASIILLDNALLLQTRIIALDGILIFMTLACFACLLWLKNKARYFSPKIILIFVIAGMCSALAVGSKFTGLLTLALALLVAIQDVWQQKTKASALFWLKGAGIFILAFIPCYVYGWHLHFALLQNAGPGDIWSVWQGEFWSKVINIHQVMLSSNAHLTATHPDMSMWWGWPFMHSAIFYWVDQNKLIYLIGNPIIWWGLALLLITFFILTILSKISNIKLPEPQHAIHSSQQLILISFFISFVPFIAVSRALFLYHYLTPLIFSIIYISLWLERIEWIQSQNLFKQRYSVYAFMIMALIAFYWILPLTYGLTEGNLVADQIFQFFPNWR